MQHELTAAPPPPAVTWPGRAALGSRAAHLAALVLYLALAILLTYPLVTHLTTAVPGAPGENGVWLYDLWRTRQSIADLGRTGAVPDAAARPAGGSLGLANHLLALPWLMAGGEILAYNALALLSFVLTGYATFLYALYITRNPYAAVVSGAILAFSPLRLHWLATGALPLLATQWLPLSLYWLERALREGRRRHAALAGAALGLAMLTTWGAAVVAAGSVILYAVVRLSPWRARSNRAARRALWPGVLIALALGAVALLGEPLPPGVAADAPPGLDDLLLPSAHHPLWGERFAGLRGAAASQAGVPGYAYLGLIAAILALLGLTAPDAEEPRTAGALVWLGVVLGLLTLGPVLRLLGQTVNMQGVPEIGERIARALARLGVAAPETGALPLPAVLLYAVLSPASAAALVRAAPLVPALALAALAGYGAASMIGGTAPAAPRRARWERARWEREDNPLYAAMRPRGGPNAGALVGALLLLALVAVDYAAAPLGCGFTAPRQGPLDRWLAEQPAQGAVMHYPLERTTSGYTLYASRTHGNPPAQATATAGNRPALDAFPAPEALALLRSRGVRYVVVDAAAYGDLTAGASTLIAQVAAAGGLRPAATLGEEEVWEGMTPAARARAGATPAGTLVVYTLE